MLSITHAAIATCATSLIIGTADPIVLAIAALASQLPDVDSTKSYTGLVLYPIAKYLEEKFSHRSVTHSFAATFAIMAIASPLALWFSWQIWAAVSIGYFFGWFSDCFTTSGVAAFYPSNARLVIPRNPKARLRTGSNGEYWVLGIAIALLVISCQFISNGGLSETFERSFFRSAETAADIFKKDGATRQVFVKISGVNIYTSEQIKDREYKIIAASETAIIGKDSNGDLYQIGKGESVQIRATSVETRLGDKVEIKAIESNPKDQFVSEWISSIPDNAYISGNLFIDNMEGLKLPLEQKKYNVLKISTSSIELLNAQKQNLEPILESFIIQGKAIIKVRSDESALSRSTREIRSGDRLSTNQRWCRAKDQGFGFADIS